MYASKIYAKVEIRPYAGQRFIRGFMNNSFIPPPPPPLVPLGNLLSIILQITSPNGKRVKSYVK